MRSLIALCLAASVVLALPPFPVNHADAPLRAVQFVDANEGWACGDDGVVLHSIDGGKTWERQKTGTRGSLRGLHFLTPYTGYIAGRMEHRHGSAGILLKTDDGGLTWQDLGAGYLPGLDGIRFENDKIGRVWGDSNATFIRGSFRTTDGGQSWTMTADDLPRNCISNIHYGTEGKLERDGKSIALPVAENVRDCIDFRGGCVQGTGIWLIGRPGSVILHSNDQGTNWTFQKSNCNATLHAIHMQSPTFGVAVGDLGTVLRTTDGGQNWTPVRSGGQRAALLSVTMLDTYQPFDIMPELGLRDGYLCVQSTIAGPENPAAQYVARQTGAALCEAAAFLPYEPHAQALTPPGLTKYWSAKDLDRMRRRLVLMLRIWQPDVLVTGSFEHGSPAEIAVNHNIAEAVKLAADANKYPEQLAAFHLKPHAVRKLYANAMQGKIQLDFNLFDAQLADSPREYAAASNRILGMGKFDARTYRLISSVDPEAAKHAQLMEGCNLARGGTARRTAPTLTWAANYLELQKKRHEERSIWRSQMRTPEFEKLWPSFETALKQWPDSFAAETLLAFAADAALVQDLPRMREYLQLIANNYPTEAAAHDAIRWLSDYHASGENLRRLELGLHKTYRKTTFLQVPLTPEGTIQVAYSEPAMRKVRFRSLEEERAWLGTGLDQSMKLFAIDAQSPRDLKLQLLLSAARQRLGMTADAEQGLRNSIAMVDSPWGQAVASELWLLNRGTSPKPAKSLALCRIANARPHLDGELNDDCWKTAEPLHLQGKLAATAVQFACDHEYLYVAGRCARDAGPLPAKAAARERDSDVRGEDHVQILLDLDRDYSSYYRFRVDCRGRVADDCTGDQSWSPNWYVAVKNEKDAWTFEAAIPFTELTGKTPRAMHAWAINAVRVLPGHGVSAWSLPAGAEPKPEGMALLEFRK